MLIVAMLFAVLVGISLGMLGGGGSILTLPVLRYVLGIEAHQAIATSLFVVGTTSLAGLVVHAVQGRVRWRTGISFGLASMLGAYVAGRVAHHIPAALLLLGFSLMMGATALAMLRRERVPVAKVMSSEPSRPGLRLIKLLTEGVAAGAVTGLVGAGGGFVVIPVLVLLEKLPIQVAIGTSLLVIALKSFAGLAGFLDHTTIDWRLALVFGAAAAAGSFGGSALAMRISARGLRSGFGWFVVAMSFFVLSRELPPLLGQSLSPAAAALAAAAATGLLGLMRRVFASHSKRQAQEAHAVSSLNDAVPQPPGGPF